MQSMAATMTAIMVMTVRSGISKPRMFRVGVDGGFGTIAVTLLLVFLS